MGISFLVSFLLFFFVYATAFLLPIHGKIQLPVTDTIAVKLHEVYIVHVQKPNAKKFYFFKHRKDWYQSFLPNTTLFTGEPRLIYAYRQVITGFAAWLTQDELKAMKSMDGFLLANQDSILQHRTTYTPQFLGLDRAQGMWYDSGYGQGQIIAVIDKGVKPTHPSFDGHGMSPPPSKWNGTCFWGQPICNNKLIGAQGFNGGHSVSPLEENNGHGSHTASIAAGNFVSDANVLTTAHGTASGIAPKAHLAVYKVTKGSDLLKSIDEAIRNNVDVVSIAQGDRHPEFDANRIVIGLFAAATNGIVSCAAAPNSGPFVSSMDNDSPWIITVGATSTDRRISATVKLGNGVEFNGESAYQPTNYSSLQLPLVERGPDFKDKIVIRNQRDNNTAAGDIVKQKGAKALIVHGALENTTLAEPHLLPAAFVTSYAGFEIRDYISSTSNATAAIIFNSTQFGVQPTPAVATFSGRGPSPRNGGIIKPDVIAPGVNILAAWPFEIGLNHTGTNSTFLFSSGTSMATPHVAGLAALLLHNHPTWSVAAIKSAIMTTARIVGQDGNPISDQNNGEKANIFATGSGLIDPVAANDPGLIYDIQPHDYIRYLCGLGTFNDNQVNAIIRGNITCSTIRSIKAKDLNYPSIGVSLDPNITSKTVTRKVTNVGDGDTTYTIDFEEPNGVNIVISPTTLNFNNVGEIKSFNVTISIKNNPMPSGEVSEGQLSWVSGKYLVRSPIIVTFI